MRYLLLPLVVLLTGPAALLHAETANQRITAVTVYPDRALVTRSGTVTLPGGVQTVVFDHLPLNLEEDSVRARASSHSDMKILGVELRRDYREVPLNADMKKLQDGVMKIDDELRVLSDEQADLNKRTEFLDRIREKVTSTNGGTKNAEGSAQDIQALFAMYGNEGSKISTRLRAIDFESRDLNKQREAMAGQLNLLQQPATPNTRSALVTVDAGSGGSIDMAVTYMMPGASWEPQYDAYADSGTQKVELTYYGVVRQTTGENWDDVTLTLSSARPSLAARLPEMMPWTVDFFETRNEEAMDKDYLPKAAARLKSMNASQVTANVSVPADMMPSSTTVAAPPAPMELSEVRSLGPSAAFLVPAKTTIPSDDQPHRSAICVQSLKGEWTYEAAPKLAAGVFLKTRVTNTSGGPLLGGQINAFLGNNFAGKSSIGLVADNASFDLFLGTDENIKITRTEGVAKEETGGLLSKQRIYKRSFTIEVENFKSTAILLKLRDQVPVSTNGDIQVHMDTTAPALTAQNADTGEITWEMKLRPAQKQKFTEEYEVETPFDKPLLGI